MKMTLSSSSAQLTALAGNRERLSSILDAHKRRVEHSANHFTSAEGVAAQNALISAHVPNIPVTDRKMFAFGVRPLKNNAINILFERIYSKPDVYEIQNVHYGVITEWIEDSELRASGSPYLSYAIRTFVAAIWPGRVSAGTKLTFYPPKNLRPRHATWGTIPSESDVRVHRVGCLNVLPLLDINDLDAHDARPLFRGISDPLLPLATSLYSGFKPSRFTMLVGEGSKQPGFTSDVPSIHGPIQTRFAKPFVSPPAQDTSHTVEAFLATGNLGGPYITLEQMCSPARSGPNHIKCGPDDFNTYLVDLNPDIQSCQTRLASFETFADSGWSGRQTFFTINYRNCAYQPVSAAFPDPHLTGHQQFLNTLFV